MAISKAAVLNARLRRQGLLAPAEGREDYLALFARLQPVPPPYFSYPGSPPSLTHRTTFDDMELAGRLRERRELVKGRFLNKTIGYVLESELGMYANAFQRPLGKMTWLQRQVFETLRTTGPLTPRQLSEETGLLNKEIMPALHRLQEAFLVYEDQLTTDWERGWYVFASEWPDITVNAERWEAAASEVLLRFLAAHVFATAQQVKDWSGWGSKDVQRLLGEQESRGTVIPATIPGLGDGWLRVEDTNLPTEPAPPTVFMLHKADPLVRAHASELKAHFPSVEVLQYLLIDGAFQGAVLGHWRIGPHDVEDIAVTLPPAERATRQGEIIRAVAWVYQPPFSHIRQYAGAGVEGRTFALSREQGKTDS